MEYVFLLTESKAMLLCGDETRNAFSSMAFDTRGGSVTAVGGISTAFC